MNLNRESSHGRVITYILLTVLVIGFQTSICFAQNAASEIYKKGAPTIVLIKSDKGGGSGFIVSSSGIVVTAYHVIDGAERVAIKTDAGDIYDEVSLLAKDERKDLAILKIAGFDLPYAELGNSNNISPGDPVIVLGNPLAVDQLKTSISDGILSGVRDLGDGFKVLQITAPISPGNSGGAVYSSAGKIIGVVSFKLIMGESLNFAIPINYVRGLLESVDPNKPVSKWAKSAKDDLFTGKNAPDMTGVWKANNGQVLRIKDTGKQVLILNLTFPETNVDAQRFDDVVLGVIFGGGTFGGNKHFLIKLNELDRLLFYWFDLKSKDSVEDVARKISEKLKKRPDYLLYRID